MDHEPRPRVLLLGLDRYALEACVRHGCDAVVVCGAGPFDDGLVEVPGGLTVVRADDQSSFDSVLMALYRAGLGDSRVDAIHTTDEWAVVTASLLARHFGCDFLDPVTAIRFRDKYLQKRRVAEAGVDTAAVTVIDDIHDVSAVREVPYRKAVLKPAAGAATARTSVIESLADLRQRSRAYREQRTSQRTFVLEEFIPGDEWLADGLMHDGELLFCALARYGAPCLAVVDGARPLSTYRFDPEDDAEAYELGLPVVRRALGALGLRSGAFHMELFHDPATGRITFSECAARRGGAMVHEELQAKFNVNLSETAVLLALGRRPDLQVKRDPRFFGSTYLMGRPGVLAGCASPAEVAARPGVEFVRIERPYGTRFTAGLASTNQRVGQFMAAGGSRAELAWRLEEVRAWFAGRLVMIPEGASGRDQRAWQRAAYPGADFRDTAWG